MKYPSLLILCLLLPYLTFSQKNYKAFIDLNNVVDDQLEVTIEVPEISENEIEFRIPKIVPGTYSIYDFGRFTSGFRAFDSNGSLLEVERITPNRRLIMNAKQLSKITYWVEDTYDTKRDNFVFEPAGTNIDDGKNFILNTYGFIGYLENYEDLPYILEIKHPTTFFGASGLKKVIESDSIDKFTAPNYFDLADGPIMYCEPDTSSFQMGGAEILVSVYSPNDIADSEYTVAYIKETLKSQKDYLNGQLPIDRYVFIVYHFSGIFSRSLTYGALEHSYSSLYSLPELHPIIIAQNLKDFTAHEFFHIVTPLNIHSEEIGNFDFIEPKMSKHLWLYEGVTEYAAGLAQVKYGQMDTEHYLNLLLGKIKASGKYNDKLPFTELSEKCLDEHKSQYGNVYQKGALIGLCLDIELRELSKGEYGIQNLMEGLSIKFGKTKSFKDDELFDVITEMTFPEIGVFFERHVAGGEDLPLGAVFSAVGITFTPSISKREVSLGNIHFKSDIANNSILITGIDDMNEFGKELGYQSGDVLYKFDNHLLYDSNFKEVFDSFKKNHQSGDKIDVVVLRKNSKGKEAKVKLSGHVIEVETQTSVNLGLNPSANERQLILRKSWINK